MGCDAAAAASAVVEPAPVAEPASPVLVELFTSQGCSSCPPADELLAELADDDTLDIIPVAFHVDYWNHIGWRDPFSSADWSARQRGYAAARGSRRVYTPQLLFNGRDHAVGTNRSLAHAAIAEQRKQTTVAVRVEAQRLGDTIQATAAATPESDMPQEDISIWIALVRDDATTKVRSGENASKTLRNAFIVYELAQACSFRSGQSCEASFDAPAFEAHVVAWVQTAATMRVMGSGLGSVTDAASPRTPR